MLLRANGEEGVVCDAACQTKNAPADGAGPEDLPQLYNTLIHKDGWNPALTVVTALANILAMIWLIKYFYDKL
jgi:hypothetical protein